MQVKVLKCKTYRKWFSNKIFPIILLQRKRFFPDIPDIMANETPQQLENLQLNIKYIETK